MKPSYYVIDEMQKQIAFNNFLITCVYSIVSNKKLINSSFNNKMAGLEQDLFGESSVEEDDSSEDDVSCL